MKWFLELGPCWGGAATVTPATDGGSLTSPRQHEEVNRTPTTSHRRRSKYKGTMHWKPKLHAILEDNYNSCTTTLNNHVNVTKLGLHMAMADIIKKQSVKIKHIMSAKKVTKSSRCDEEYTREY
ncbi:hypothetical protein Leryth_027202 [Lithospermum erythrorhizon]|nr:hypothetical protein Leryth_027202 [Lithospermum erythrorhizon]